MSSPPKRICLLGATGSIGSSTLSVVRDFPDRYEIVGLSAHQDAEALAKLAGEFEANLICLSGSEDNGRPGPPTGPWKALSGAEGLCELIEACEPDLVVVSTVGASGLAPTLRAIDLGITVALATKEVLVMAGELVMDRAWKRGCRILPIDSEHSAIFQCLEGRSAGELTRIQLTASGGPFRGRSKESLADVSIEEALRHPTWTMGKKVTIDSATMMNKGLEVIEGRYLFDVPGDRIDIIVHPQSVVHSMVEFVDGAVIAHMGVTDMYLPIAYALAYPERHALPRFESLDLAAIGKLEFECFAPEAFPCPGLAYEALRLGGTYPTALNAANEVAVELFLEGRLGFTEIAETIEAVLDDHTSLDAASLDEIIEADRQARERARQKAGAFSKASLES